MGTEGSTRQEHRVEWLSAKARLWLIAVGFAVAGAGRVAIWYETRVALATVALVAGALLAAWAAGAPANPSVSPPGPFAGWGRREYAGLFTALAGTGLFAYATYTLFTAWQASFDWAAPLMVLAVAIASIGLGWLDHHWRRQHRREAWSWREVLALGALVALAAFLRFYRIHFFPPTDGFVAIEEAQSGQGAWDIYANGVRPWEFLLDRWMPVPFFHWLGVDLIPLRIPFIIVSVLTVLATYVLLRQLVTWPAALFATFLLTVAHWHLHYARLAHNIFPTTLLSVIVWTLCIRQAQTGGFRLYPWIGFFCGYSLYAYAGYRGIPIIVAVFLLALLVRAFVQWRTASPELLAAARRQFLLAAGGTALVGAFFLGPGIVLIDRLRHNPMYFFEAYIRSYNNKEYYTSDWGSWLAKRWERQIQTARIFHHWGDTEQAYNLPGEPMLDPATGVLFTTALFFCVLYWRRRFQGFFAFAFLLLLFLGATLTQTLVVARLQIVVPLAFVLIGFFAHRVWTLALAAGSAVWRAAVAGAALVIAGAALAYNWEEYFGRTMHSPVVRAVYRNYYTTAIVYLRSLPDQAFLYLVSDMHNFFSPSDYAWWRGFRVPGKVSFDLYPLLSGARGPWNGRELHVLIQRPFEQPELSSLLRDYFPSAECRLIQHPEGYPHLDQTACRIPDQLPRLPPRSQLRARYFALGQDPPLLERPEPAVSWALVPDACTVFGGSEEKRCKAEWEGTFVLPAGGEWELAIEARNAKVEGKLDGDEIRARSGVPIEGYLLGGIMTAERRKLAAGEHRLQLTAEFSASTDIGVRVRVRDGHGPWQLLRFDEAVGSGPAPANAEQAAAAPVGPAAAR